MKASLGRIELVPILTSRKQSSPWGDNDAATEPCSKRHLICRRMSSEAASPALEGRELVRKSLVNAIACAGRVLHPRLASKSLPQLETVSSACSSHSPRFAKKSHAPGRESNTNPTGFRDFVPKRFRQIAKPPVDESLLLLKNLIRRSEKQSRMGRKQFTRNTRERRRDGMRCRREPEQPRAGGELRGAGRGRTPGRRPGTGASPGGEREAGAESGGRGQQNPPLVRVRGRKTPRNVTRGGFWRKRVREGAATRGSGGDHVGGVGGYTRARESAASSPWPATRTSRR